MERSVRSPTGFRKQSRNGYLGSKNRTDFSLNRDLWDLLQPALLSEKTAIQDTVSGPCAKLPRGPSLAIETDVVLSSLYHWKNRSRATARRTTEPSRSTDSPQRHRSLIPEPAVGFSDRVEGIGTSTLCETRPTLLKVAVAIANTSLVEGWRGLAVPVLQPQFSAYRSLHRAFRVAAMRLPMSPRYLSRQDASHTYHRRHGSADWRDFVLLDQGHIGISPTGFGRVAYEPHPTSG